MKKILYLIIVSILVLSGIQVTALNKIDKNVTVEINEEFVFSTPQIISNENYISIKLEENTKFLQDPGKPEMPMVPQTFELPFKAKNIEIERDEIFETEQKENIFSSFGELEIRFQNFQDLLSFTVTVQPSSVELLEPDFVNFWECTHKTEQMFRSFFSWVFFPLLTPCSTIIWKISCKPSHYRKISNRPCWRKRGIWQII